MMFGFQALAQRVSFGTSFFTSFKFVRFPEYIYSVNSNVIYIPEGSPNQPTRASGFGYRSSPFVCLEHRRILVFTGVNTYTFSGSYSFLNPAKERQVLRLSQTSIGYQMIVGYRFSTGYRGPYLLGGFTVGAMSYNDMGTTNLDKNPLYGVLYNEKRLDINALFGLGFKMKNYGYNFGVHLPMVQNDELQGKSMFNAEIGITVYSGYVKKNKNKKLYVERFPR
jgi:hypothetical protein